VGDDASAVQPVQPETQLLAGFPLQPLSASWARRS
jgi:hypothetical protein